MLDNYKWLKISDFDYHLPDDRIAKYPLKERDMSKLLHFDGSRIEQKRFLDLADLLSNDDLLVFNNTKVIQARLRFAKTTGSQIEIFCLEPLLPNDYQLSFQTTESCVWSVMIGNFKKWKTGEVLFKTVDIEKNTAELSVKYLNSNENMTHRVEFCWNNKNLTFGQIVQHIGELPIPPYLNRRTEELDNVSYQTVYSKILGSVAAPTAGLHFTDNVFNKLIDNNIKTVELTLHVGAGTFQPVKSDTVAEHKMHAEYFEIEILALKSIIKNIDNVVAVGTTSVRTLESLYYIGCNIHNNPKSPDLCVTQWQPYENHYGLSVQEALNSIVEYMERRGCQRLATSTRIIILPGYSFKLVKKIITNFHQPKSTLLLLVSAFVGNRNRENIYDFALDNNFRFLSYGDSSLLELKKHR